MAVGAGRALTVGCAGAGLRATEAFGAALDRTLLTFFTGLAAIGADLGAGAAVFAGAAAAALRTRSAGTDFVALAIGAAGAAVGAGAEV
ncbi:hypothetical protein [Allosphingosinicella deserti]|uniref:hypothetical protein n=1 Tax=Allosphingosinicella deserti TaxID=2116704 RepID=UPI001E4EFD4C|nr:hypothetical protein [Sphingomonas deserti]